MQIQRISSVGENYDYRWPSGNTERFDHWIEYEALAVDGSHGIRVGFGYRATYGEDRSRVVIWVDGKPQAEFLGADDYTNSGDVLSELKVPGEHAQRICRYPDEPVPERYAGLPIVGLPTRVSGPSVHGAWAVVANVADHRTMCALAALRRLDRERQKAT